MLSVREPPCRKKKDFPSPHEQESGPQKPKASYLIRFPRFAWGGNQGGRAGGGASYPLLGYLLLICMYNNIYTGGEGEKEGEEKKAWFTYGLIS